MSMEDSIKTGFPEEAVYCSNRQGTVTLAELMQPGSQCPDVIFTDTGDCTGSSNPSSVEYDFFDKEEQKRREEYRNRVEKHYCRLIEEERLSPESASFLSDAFAEAEVRAKYGTIGQRSKEKLEYHTGIDKNVWREVDHQRSKSLERLKSQQCDNVTDNTADKCSKAAVNLSLNMDTPRDSLDTSGDYSYFHTDSASGLESSGQLDTGQFQLDHDGNNMEFSGDEMLNKSGYSGVMEDLNDGRASPKQAGGFTNCDSGYVLRSDNEALSNTDVVIVRDDSYGGIDKSDDESGSGQDGTLKVKAEEESWNNSDLGSRNYGDGEESSETLNLESEEENTDSDDEFDFQNSAQREWVNKRGDLAMEKSMEAWLGSPKPQPGVEGQDNYFKDQVQQYKDKIAARARGKITEMLKQSSSVPSGSPTPVDYDADEEVSYKEPSHSSTHSLDHWSDSQVDYDDTDAVNENRLSTQDKLPLTYDFSRKPRSNRSSVSSDRNRVDHSTYQSYTAGLLHSSGKSEKFLKLQKHFAVLERITALEEKARLQGIHHGESGDLGPEGDMFAKYDVQSREELQWLYQELNEARRNEEFFYDLQKLAVYQWKPSKDFGLKKKGKSLNDLRKVYEHGDSEDATTCSSPFSDSFFKNAMEAERNKFKNKSTPSGQKIKVSATKSSSSQTSPKPIQRPLYGTNIPEQLDDYEIIVEAKKQMNKQGHNEHLHVRSISSPYTDIADDGNSSLGHRRSDSSKGSLFARPSEFSQSERRSKPTVAEVTPVRRQGKQKSPRRAKILSGPHDFASRVTDTETVARPMQSNLQIYNSLENPQYQATVTFDEGIPARKLSRGRSSDFMISKDADGNYIVTSVDRSQNRSQPLGNLDSSRSPRVSTVESPLKASKTLKEDFEPPDNSSSSKESFKTKFGESDSRGQSSNSVSLSQRHDPTNLTDVSRCPPPPPRRSGHYQSFRHSGVDKTPVASVRSAVKTFEHQQDDVENSQILVPTQFSRSRTVPDLLSSQALPEAPERKLAEQAKSSSDRDVSQLANSSGDQKGPMLKAPTRDKYTPVTTFSQPKFKVRNLRPLAENNEFCESMFFPKHVKPTSAADQMPEPVLHNPVTSKTFQSKYKPESNTTDDMKICGSWQKNMVEEKKCALEQRRHSTSSTDTFIVKESDDEVDEMPLNVTYTKDNFTSARSKSEPDLSEAEEEPVRPRSAKSTADLKDPYDTLNQSGRHCIPRTISGNLNELQKKYPYKFPQGRGNQGTKYKQDYNPQTENPNTNVEHKQELYEGYMPPDEIVKDMMKSQELYKRKEPKEKPKTPSDVSKMTMNYLQEIGQEWSLSKDKQRNSPLSIASQEPVSLPAVQNFIGSDTATTPNRWVPVLETKNSMGPLKSHIAPEVSDYQHNVNNSAQNVGSISHNQRPSPQVNRKNGQGYERNYENHEPCFHTGSDSENKKYMTMPLRPKTAKGGRPFTYTTIPRMRPDSTTYKAKDAQSLMQGIDTGNGKKCSTGG